MIHNQTFASPGEALKHYGVQGMRWGHRKDRDHGDDDHATAKEVTKQVVEGTGEALAPHEQAILRKLGLGGPKDSENMRLKYGPDPKHLAAAGAVEIPRSMGLTQGQKTALIVGGSAALVVGAAFGAYYLKKHGPELMQNFVDKQMDKAGFGQGLLDDVRLHGTSDGFKTFFSKMEGDKLDHALDGPLEKFKSLGGLADEEVELPIGQIFKRVSTEMETKIRPDGFYAAFKDEDVARYKAALPIFWKGWEAQGVKGFKNKGEGFVVNLKSKAPIKAPSMRESFKIWEEMVAKDESLIPAAVKLPYRMFGNDAPLDPRAMAEATYNTMSQQWANPKSKTSKRFFEEVKKRGYNALIDVNDAGNLAEKPMRLIDGSIFEVAGHEPLSKAAIKEAQDKVLAVAHSALELGRHIMQKVFGKEAKDGE